MFKCIATVIISEGLTFLIKSKPQLMLKKSKTCVRHIGIELSVSLKHYLLELKKKIDPVYKPLLNEYF